MTAKRRILFVNDEMRMGGVARVLNTLMRALPEDLYDVDLLVLHKEGMLLDEIPEKVRVFEGSPFFRTVDEPLSALMKGRNIGLILSKLRLLFYMKTGLIKKRIEKERRKILKEHYDVEVAAKEGFCTIFTAYGDSARKINWVLTDYSVNNYSRNHMKLVKEALHNIDLNIADSDQALKAYMDVFSIDNGVTVHNLMDTEKVKRGMMEEEDTIIHDSLLNVITVARFHPQKGLDRLLRASKDAYIAGNPHHLYLVGGGELEEELRRLADELKMDHVHFLGYRSNPYALIAHCDLFVLSSLYEGFATVINESLIAGTPVLTTRVSGTEEQITDPMYGWIVENDQESLTEGLKKALSSIADLEDMKLYLKRYEYDNDAVLQQFMKVL